MKYWNKIKSRWLGWLLAAVMLVTGLTACGQADAVSIDKELVGQAVSAAADVVLEEMLAEEVSEEDVSEGDVSERDVSEGDVPDEDGWYHDKDTVALYIHLYDHLPGNYLTKSEAEELGWDSSKGNLDEVAPGMSIGGNKFGNREGLLPKDKGRTYYECDVNYEGGYRGGERIVYSSDGLIYYTEDHYENFELLYTKEGPEH